MNELEFLGSPGSPYSMKMRAYLRYRKIPYKMLRGLMTGIEGYPKSKTPMLPTFYLPKEDGDLEAVIDSTPIIRRLENEYSLKKTLPNDNRIRFIVDLIEDYADEWLTKVMFHYRWAIEHNAKHVAPKLVYWMDHTISEKIANEMVASFSKRQKDRLKYVGSNEITKGTIENSYTRFITILDSLLSQHGFVVGKQPSAADFAIYGQLSQLTRVEPTSSEICSNLSPRVMAWVDRVSDASDISFDSQHWSDFDEVCSNLQPLLSEIGKTYIPLLITNANALKQDDNTVKLQIDGIEWIQDTFTYQGKCLIALAQSYTSLNDSEKASLYKCLQGTGCDVLIDEFNKAS
ncbi:glutathione S-transferase family protein [Glaciecola petra]|uniref:Glutathione S-transferase family protein n=1 Tax=Glaciecola petra TaxID=3075602 RepID=A0ABU2ZUZ4_9ALTE|nr:glutathione S-transferase family protein [Aestuariibacter sp. P117]MDT0596462.1 glutathione S-transferase family protein [Aestuariibacter sp. P117]